MPSAKTQNFVKLLLFFALFLVLLTVISVSIDPVKWYDDNRVQNRNARITEMKKQEPRTIDVLNMGDSLSLSSLSPMEMWRQKGYTSFNIGADGIRMPEVYYTIVEAAQEQEAKYLLFETLPLFRYNKKQGSNICRMFVRQTADSTMGGGKMYKDGKVWLALNDYGEEICLLPGKANRHGLIAGATGTGKTVTLRVMAEAFSDMGVPVFLADVKGDLAGMMAAGTDSDDMKKRIERFGLAEQGFSYKGYPVTFWDIYGEKGIQLRTTVSEMGPTLLARIMQLNDLQTDILTIVFKIADDNDLLLIDTKDLKAMLNHVNENHKEYEAEYGKMSAASIAAILRAVVALEIAGGDVFFGEPGLNIHDWIAQEDGKGMINILDSESLINNGRLYSTFLLWMLSELFEMLPEVGDPAKPKMVFFFDEAHLLFKDAPKSLLEKIEQVVKLIRSKGVGVYFCTQNPRDIPDGVLAQLGNKVQHALRAYTPADQKSVKAAAASFRENPEFSTYDTILALGTGEAIISFLQEDGIPGIVQKTKVLPPQSRMGGVTDYEREQKIKESLLYSKYAKASERESAYEILIRLGIEREEALARAKEEEAEAKLRAKEEAALEKAALKEKEKAARAKKRAAKSVGSTVAGTVGREVGKTVGSNLGGKFGKTLGGNIGASLGRGILDTLFGR